MPYDLGNPYAAKPNALGLNIPTLNVSNTNFQPSSDQTTVISQQPILRTNSSLNLPTGNFTRVKSQAEKDFDARMKLQKTFEEKGLGGLQGDGTNKTGWWATRTKVQKGLVIGGAVAVVSIIGFFVVKKLNK